MRNLERSRAERWRRAKIGLAVLYSPLIPFGVWAGIARDDLENGIVGGILLFFLAFGFSSVLGWFLHFRSEPLFGGPQVPADRRRVAILSAIVPAIVVGLVLIPVPHAPGPVSATVLTAVALWFTAVPRLPWIARR